MMADFEQHLGRLLSRHRGSPLDRAVLLSAYQRGHESGTQATEAPELTAVEARFQSLSTTFTTSRLGRISTPEAGTLDESVVFRQGYANGLADFLKTYGVDLRFAGFYASPDRLRDVLRDDAVVVGYLQGMRRQSPGIDRKLPAFSTTEEISKEFLYSEQKPNWQIYLEQVIAQRRHGYQLGFLVGVARDFDITLNPFEVPTDNPTHLAFMQGLNAEPRAMPIEPKPARHELEKKFSRYDGLASGVSIYDALDNMAYVTGQRVWLASQGLDTKYVFFIREPESLGAFKVGLEGQVLPELMPSPPSYRTRLDPLPENNLDKSLRNYEPIPQKLKGFESVDAAREQRRLAYETGLKARITRKQPNKDKK